MSKKFEISVRINAPLEEVFNLFSDPEEIGAVAGFFIDGLTRMPATVGTKWSTQGNTFGKTQFLVTANKPPYLFTKQLTGNIVGTIEDHFEYINGRTKVTSRFDIQHLPTLENLDTFRRSQRFYLQKLKTHLERRTIDKILNRVKFSYSVTPSTLIKGRKQAVIELEVVIAADIKDVFDIAICQVDQFWEWMFDLADSDGHVEVSSDWPQKGSYYRFRVKSNVPFVKWEKGLVRVMECDAPKYILMREDRTLPIFGSISLIEWKFEPLDFTTRVINRYTIIGVNFFANALITSASSNPALEALKKQISNLTQICESR